MKKLKVVLVIILLVVSIISTHDNYQYVSAKAEGSAKSFVVVDVNGKSMKEFNADSKREVASICKLMTSLITLEHIENGAISLDDKFVASSHASSAEGSQAFLDAGSEYSVRDLLKSVIVASANDSAIVLAEGIAGSESAFVELMNTRARQLEMSNTMYANSTGLPAIEQYSTARDTAILLNIVSEYDLYVEDSNIWIDKLVHPSGRETELVNTNRLIKYYTYCTAGKTGFTDEAGYCLASTAVKDNLKVITVVLGCDSSANRFKESIELYNHAYANYKNQKVLSADTPIDNTVQVLLGKTETIKLVPQNDYYLVQAKTEKSDYTIEYSLPKNIKAPISAGDEVGMALIVVNGQVIAQVNLVSAENIARQNFKDILDKITDNWAIVG